MYSMLVDVGDAYYYRHAYGAKSLSETPSRHALFVGLNFCLGFLDVSGHIFIILAARRKLYTYIQL